VLALVIREQEIADPPGGLIGQSREDVREPHLRPTCAADVSANKGCRRGSNKIIDFMRFSRARRSGSEVSAHTL